QRSKEAKKQRSKEAKKQRSKELTQRSQGHRAHREERSGETQEHAREQLCLRVRVEEEGDRGIPPLRGPTRHNSARKRESGRSGRDDKFGAWGLRGKNRPLRSG